MIQHSQNSRKSVIYSQNFIVNSSLLKEGLKKIFTNYQFLRLAKELGFSSSVKPTDLNFSQWLGLFNFFTKGTDISKKALIGGFEDKIRNQQAKLDKIHRTRVAKDWRTIRE